MADNSNLWSIAIGLARLEGDPQKVCERYINAFESIKDLDATVENRMMAAEIVAASKLELQEGSSALHDLVGAVKLRANIPKEQAAGVAATIMVGRRYDGTYPVDRLAQFAWNEDAKEGVTRSCEAAAILATDQTDADRLTVKFQLFRSLFESFGYEESEDMELASAFMAVSELNPDDVKTKLTIVLDGLKNYLQYPLVAGAILASIPTLEANEALELMERAYGILVTAAPELDRTALLALSVRMLPGVENRLIKKVDATARAAAPSGAGEYVARPPIFFPWVYYIVLSHAYYVRYAGYASAHPAHPHGVGGFWG